LANLIDLDSPEIYRQLDPDGMLAHLHNFPRLCRQAWQMTQDLFLPDEYSHINKVLVLGMGGSAMGGDLVSSLAAGEARIPILVCRDYLLPGCVDSGTLVIASSYSGMTEETLSAFTQALNTPALKLAITTGGKLKAICEKEKIPVISFDYKAQPRAALPFSFFILLGLLQKLGVIGDQSTAVEETFQNLSRLTSKIDEKAPLEQNQAKSIAQKLVGRLAVVYGSGVTTEVAHRWKTQLNENSKITAFYEFFPELNHNSVVGYHLPPEIISRTMVVILNSNLLHERVRLRFGITQKLLEQAGLDFQVLQGEGACTLSQMMTLVLLGDYVSYYLALLNQVDPTPVKDIDFLKNQLAKA
jgi:glucose/mannose-6-phosphate isomerase